MINKSIDEASHGDVYYNSSTPALIYVYVGDRQWLTLQNHSYNGTSKELEEVIRETTETYPFYPSVELRDFEDGEPMKYLCNILLAFAKIELELQKFREEEEEYATIPF